MRLNGWMGRLVLLATMASVPAGATFGQSGDSATAGTESAPPVSAAPSPVPNADTSPLSDLDPRLKTESGRDARVWPPDPLFDHRHIKLELNIPDLTESKFFGIATLTMAAVAAPRQTLTLDAGKGLTIVEVTRNGRSVNFTHDQQTAKLTIVFNPPARPTEEFDLRVVYNADRPGGGGSGLTFSKDDSRTPEFDPMLHAQGQPESNHLWFPCHDFPNDRLTSEVIVTVPAPYQAVSNGVLVSAQANADAPVPIPANPPKPNTNDDGSNPDQSTTSPRLIGATEANVSGTITYHWRQDKPHASYLITLVVGRFDTVDLPSGEWGLPNLPIPVYGALGSGEALRDIFANTPEMVKHFADLFDYPFPWDQYAQVMCRNFSAGAMENTSCSTFNASILRGRRGSQDGIIAHELVHQWFGDLVGYRSWEHLWLGEGWATMGEALWAEHKGGEDGYQEAILQNFGSERAISGRRYWPKNSPMVSNRYKNPNSRFISGDNVYQKGGAVLHMLRMRLGERDFWAGVRLYLKRHAFEQVETDQFRVCLEEISGQSLERFFEQWCRRPGHPNLEIDYAWTPDAQTAPDGPGQLTVTIEQIQRIDADNPAYAFQLPVYAQFAEGIAPEGEYVYLLCDSRVTTMSFPLAHRPKSTSIDPYLTVLCRKKVRQSLEAVMDQLHRGPTYAARVHAIESLAARRVWPATRALCAAALSGVVAPSGSSSHRLVARACSATLTSIAAAVGRRTTTVLAAAQEAMMPQRVDLAAR